MTVLDVCTRDVQTITRMQSLLEAALKMAAHHVGTLVVVDEARRPEGIITDRDIVTRCVAREFNPSDVSVAEVMTEPVETIAGEAGVHEALAMMADQEIRRIVVRDLDFRVVGVLSLDDVLQELVGETAEIGRLLKTQVHV